MIKNIIYLSHYFLINPCFWKKLKNVYTGTIFIDNIFYTKKEVPGLLFCILF